MRVLETYKLQTENVPAEVSIVQRDDEYLNTYELRHMTPMPATQAVLNLLKQKVIDGVAVKVADILAARDSPEVREQFKAKANEVVRRQFPHAAEDEERFIIGWLMQEMLGLGDLEIMLADPHLEEIVVNSSKENVWVYHRSYGWLKTNFSVQSESQIQNYAEIIGRKVGRQITNLTPLMDANMSSGNRVNSVLFPVSSKGNSLVIRKFRTDPWTIVNLIDPAVNTLNVEVAALLWLCVQYEMNVIIGGGTGSGKTSFLNSIMLFTPPNQRIVSIEDTRELLLADFLHWTPLVTRQPNTEGKGEITMLDLMVNSLRMRPDRIILGETRKQREAEVLFEAMHTGHAVYSTFHAEDVFQLRNRLTNPPVNIPPIMLSAVHVAVIQYRQRKSGIRRTFEVAEFVEDEGRTSINVIYRWNPKTDLLEKVGDSVRLLNTLSLYTGMDLHEIGEELKDREAVLSYMLDKGVMRVNDVGRVIAWYYREKKRVMAAVRSGSPPSSIFAAEHAGTGLDEARQDEPATKADRKQKEGRKKTK